MLTDQGSNRDKLGSDHTHQNGTQSSAGITAPTISLPKGGGAIHGMGEKFAANPVTGTGSMSVPIATSPGRAGFGPQLALSYDSGAGNGPFGFGWSLSLPSITRKTDKGLPQYRDANESDVFILSGAEDLVPVLAKVGEQWQRELVPPRTVDNKVYTILRYRPRIEGLFARIEKWTNQTEPQDSFWRSISKDNITTWYGKSENSRIADPADPTRIFSWLIAESHDDKGNVIVYEYKAEDAADIDLGQANERNRVRTDNRYLKHIYYGNQTPYFPQSVLDNPLKVPEKWFFEVVFDYGEHDQKTPAPDDKGIWQRRNDPFSSYRSGFEVRTYRLCQRVLMFHHIPDLSKDEKGYEGLVRSTDFTYSDGQKPDEAHDPIFSFLLSVTQSGYKCQGNDYLKKSLPPVEFTYSSVKIQTKIEEVDAKSLANLPVGLDGAMYQWVDLDSEGLSGILTEQSDGWFYKRNLSANNLILEGEKERSVARFGAMELVARKPALGLAEGGQFLDLAGDGQLDLVQMNGPVRGFYEHTTDGDWASFQPFTAWPNLDMRDLNLKFVDLTGDGHADMLISEGDVLTWHPSLAEQGFGPAIRVCVPLDEEQGPRLIFADGTQSIYLADMSGDGLTDLVRIRNGAVCYWPNLGYGRFGPKVTMDDAPWFDHPDQFNQQRIRLADIDGSGITDILYLGRDRVRVYFNQSGNAWSEPQTIPFPPVDNLTAVQVVDLLGNGTACLVWSSPLPGAARHSMRYIDLMGQKPHLLVKTVNNLGAETQVEYRSSTQFYLQDRAAGKPWITKLPFPVHCVQKVTVRDKWRKTTFSTSYSYHHGYFDGFEREFRGFGRVEQVDVEEYGVFAAGNSDSPYITADQTLYQPPVKTVTWFHTGAFLDRARILNQCAHEYFPHWFEALQPGQQVLGNFRENNLPEPELDAQELTAQEWCEALRACKGMTLRQEVYELDVNALATGEQKPVKLFSAACHNCHIHRVQPQANNQHAVFQVTESEAITYHYELELRSATLAPDPRIAHTLNLKLDEYGNIQQAVSVVYPRRAKYQDADLKADALALIGQVQSELHLAYSETRYTNDVPNDPPDIPLDKRDWDNYRLRLPCEVLTYELTGIQPTDASDTLTPDMVDDRYFTLEELRAYNLSDKYPTDGTPVTELAYHRLPNRTTPQKRLVEQTRTLFFVKDLNMPLCLGQLNALALPYETYTLALTEEILKCVFNDKLEPDVQGVLSAQKISGYLSGADLSARFRDDDTTGQYWICSGVAGFNADAVQHFYLPERYTDPFGNPTLLEYDPYDLYIKSSTDALGNRTEVMEFDCRVLAPCKLKDSNDNVSEVSFDLLGMPAAMAVMGKGDEGDNLTDIDDAALNPELERLSAFFSQNDYSESAAQKWLGNASARHLYYFGETIEIDEATGKSKTVWGQHPACAAGIVREQHVTENPNSPVQTAFEYSDGAGNVLVKKVQAEPAQPGGTLRWVASGKTILNNKGKPVKQYEPYFSPPEVGHRFVEPHEVGVTPVIYYDAVGRVIRSELPDGSYSRVDLSPWQVQSYDPNDTVKTSRWYSERNPPDPHQPLPYSPITGACLVTPAQRAAWLAAQHADTPNLTILDSLGREVIAIAHNRVKDAGGKWQPEKQLTFSKLDAEGKPLWVQDARGNRVMQYIMPALSEGRHAFDDTQNLKPQGFAPCYDIAGNLLFQHSMDAGDRWMLNDAAGKPMVAWNSRGFITHVEYDALRRPTGSFVSVTGDTALNGTPRDPLLPPDPAQQVEKLVYGEEQTEDDKKYNLRGQLYQHYDTAGVVTVAAYDFKGNPRSSQRQLLADYKTSPDWAQNPALLTEIFTSSTVYDALNRPVRITTPDGSVTTPAFNKANLLNAVKVTRQAAAQPTDFVANIDYNAKGQRERIDYGNGTTTNYAYDEESFRLINLKTTRPNQADATAATLFTDATIVQDLHYTYDPVGNITQIADAAHKPIFCSNQQVVVNSDYTYDALYRLMTASGRERKAAPQSDWDDRGNLLLMPPQDATALGCYVDSYEYDGVGNILRMIHHAGGNADQPGTVTWQRRYQYAAANNHLQATSLPGDAEGVYRAQYSYDLHGNITKMPHLPTMRWDYRDQLQATAQQVRSDDGTAETTYYVYDASGQRVRQVTERQAAPETTPTRMKERIYLGGYELYREYDGAGTTVILERQTLHVLDDQQRIALLESKTIDSTVPSNTLPATLTRYQFGNHLGSASLELDEQAQVISYEEYYPYGSTAYQATDKAIKASAKRYRYTGKERDEESGLYYHGARYYAPWLGRWTACDPSPKSRKIHLYQYVLNSPICFIDPDGAEEDSIEIFHRTSQRGAAGMEHAGPEVDLSKPHVWGGEGFYGSSDPNIPGYSNYDPQGRNVVVSQKISTKNMVTLSEQDAKWLQDTPEGKKLRQEMWKGLNLEKRTNQPSNLRDYVTQMLKNQFPDKNVIRFPIEGSPGAYTYVVLSKGAFEGPTQVVGEITKNGRFAWNKQPIFIQSEENLVAQAEESLGRQVEKQVVKEMGKQVERSAAKKLLAKAPFIGIGVAAFFVYEDIARADYKNAILDALGPVPLVGQVAAGMQITPLVTSIATKNAREMDRFPDAYDNLVNGGGKAAEIKLPPPIHTWPY